MWFGGLRCLQRATLATRRNQLRASTDGGNLDPAFPRTAGAGSSRSSAPGFSTRPRRWRTVPPLLPVQSRRAGHGVRDRVHEMDEHQQPATQALRALVGSCAARGQLAHRPGVDSQSCLVVMFVRPCRPDRARCTERIQRARRRGEALGNAGGLRGHDHYDGVNDSW
jgi:hypothetical protein